MLRRKTPAIFRAAAVLGLGQALAVTFIFLAVLSGVIFLLSNSSKSELMAALQDPRNWLPIFIVALGFIIYPIVMIAIGIKAIFQSISIYLEKRKWISASCNLQVPIIERSREYDEYAEVKELEWLCSLTVRLPVLIENDVVERDIPVNVNQRTFSRYKDKDLASIHCDPNDPLLFVFEGE